MLTVAEAIAEIIARVERLPAARAALADSLGLVLAEDVFSDLDSPPFDKALMDGYAVRSIDVSTGRARLRVIEEVPAGQVPRRPVGAQEATRIMTGAPIPAGADAVVPVEHTRLETGTASASQVVMETTPLTAGRNILKRGESIRKGERVLNAGRRIRPQETGCLAELGKDAVAVYPRPRVAVLATGDELVPVNEVPGPGQIRNSNEAMLVAQLRRLGAEPVPLGIARDRHAELADRIARGLGCDMLLLSGGVSAGKLDLVPAVLAEVGVRQVFHKVRVKPGQPVWFGVLERPEGPGAGDVEGKHAAGQPPCCVFGLPGNPVSSMVCCELFAGTAVRRLMGIEPAAPTPTRARMKKDHFNGGTRPTYHPAWCEATETGNVVEPVRWVGSADLCATAEANAMVLFPEGERIYPAGTMVDVFLW
ncbi:MAG: gephyrin-like molybdotransferase Glp [Deltaproteobacteria bacterium]